MDNSAGHLDDAVARLEAISWGQSKCAIGNEQAALLRLYLSNAAKFLDSRESNEQSAFFDASEISAPEQVLLTGPSRDLLACISGEVNAFTTGICRCYLKWAALQDAGNKDALQFCDLYEPLIVLIEQGVSFGGIRKGELILGEEGYEIPLTGWRRK